MPALDATVKGPNANSYVTTSEADVILAGWLYTAGWDAASDSPSASGYETVGSAGAGATSITIDTGSGDVTDGMLFQFTGIGDSTVYTARNGLTGPGLLTFTPALAVTVPDNTPIDRLTANPREQALILSTFSLDYSFAWEGFKRDITTPQALDHPRSGMFDDNGDFYDFDLVAQPVKFATAYQANVLLERNILAKPSALGLGVTEARADVFSVKIDTSAASAQLEPVDDFVQNILSELGQLKASATRGARVVGLGRA